MTEEIERSMVISSIQEKPRKYMKIYSDDETDWIFLSHEKVADEFDVDEDQAGELIDLAVDQDKDLETSFYSREDISRKVGLSEDDLELLSKDPNGYWSRVKRGFQRQKKAWLVPGNFLAGILAGALIDRWYVQVIVVLLIAGDIISAWFHGRLDIDGT